MSVSGLALAAVHPLGALPVVSDEFQLELTLPHGRVKTRARTEWVQRRAGFTDGRERIALGLSFVDLPPAAHAVLTRCVEEYRPHALLVFADPGQLRLARAVLDREFAIDEARTIAEAAELLATGTISVVVAFGAPQEVVDLGQATGVDSERDSLSGPFEDPRARIVFAGTATPDELLALHNRRLLFRSVDRLDSRLGPIVREAAADFAAQRELQRLGLQRERDEQRDHRTPSAPADDGIVHQSGSMKAVLDLTQTAARYQIAVLVVGETGTGKELIARSIHEGSLRARAPFIAQDCGALTETLLESELFGHVRGAFTGAIANHPGLFSVAEGGTIFLDEIENTTFSMQAKLLRVLETGVIRPVGGTVSRKVDVRIIAASNRDLWAETQAGRFRSDLYFRLNRFVIELPPLRDRPEDIRPLVDSLLRRVCGELGRDVPAVEPAVLGLFEAYSWPGNVRELRNVLERAALLTPPGRAVGVTALPRPLTQVAPAQPLSLRDRMREHESRLIREALARNGGVMRRAAQELRMNPVTLARRARGLGLL